MHVQGLLMLIDLRAATTDQSRTTKTPQAFHSGRAALASCERQTCRKASQRMSQASDQQWTSAYRQTSCRSTCIGVRVLPALGRQLLPTCAEPLAVEGVDMENQGVGGVVSATLG
jgi:hypothetical protein